MIPLMFVVAILNVVIFLLTQNIAAQFVIIDTWFAPMAVLLVAECLFGRFAKQPETDA
jgi:hypothetical protein